VRRLSRTPALSIRSRIGDSFGYRQPNLVVVDGQTEVTGYDRLAYRVISARAARIIFASTGPKESSPSFAESITAASAFISSTACSHCFFRLPAHSRVDETHPADKTAAMERQHAT